MPRSSVAVPRQVVRDFGTCLNFSADGNKVTTASTISLAGAFTIYIWFKRNSGNSGDFFLGNDSGSAKIGFFGGTNERSMFMRLVNGGSSSGSVDFGYTDNLNGKWNFLAIVRDGANAISTSLNGAAFVSIATLSGTTTFNLVGADQTPNTFIGKLDELVIAPSVSTISEVQNAYYSGIYPSTKSLWYKFDEGSGTSATDSSGNSNTGTITGATYSTDVFIKPRTAAGNRIKSGIDLNKCVNFNQAASKVTFTVPTSMNPANIPQFTCAAWVFPRSIGAGNAGRIIEPVTAGAGIRLLTGSGNTFSAQVPHTVTTATRDSGNGSIKFGQWQRVLFTWSDSDNTPTIYINGVNYTNGSSTNKSGSRNNWATATAYIGNNNTDTRNFDGLIDEFCIWNRVLTAQEISDDFYKASIASSGLILRYKMDEASGDLTDSSASGLTGTPTSVTQNVASYTTGTRTAA